MSSFISLIGFVFDIALLILRSVLCAHLFVCIWSGFTFLMDVTFVFVITYVEKTRPRELCEFAWLWVFLSLTGSIWSSSYMMIRRYDQVDSTSEKLVFYTNYLIAYICKMQASASLLKRSCKEKKGL